MESFSIGTIDIVIVVVYLLFIIWWGVKNGKSSDAQSYFLAGRSMPWWVVGLSLFAASISSTTLIGQSGDAYDTGLAVFNYNLTGIVVMVFFAVFLLPLYIRSKVFTIPEFLEKRFDKRSRYYFSAICIIGNIFLDAAGALYAAALIIKLVLPEADLQMIIIVFAIIAASYTIPGGIWVNKALAQDNNINVPKPDWNIDQFTRFISKADCKEFWGSKGTPIEVLELGTDNINKKILEENKVELNSEQVKSLLKYLPKWAEKSIDVAAGSGKITKDIVKENGGYSWTYFTNNRTLINFEDPWYLTSGADEDAKDSPSYIKSADWDIYPYPSTDYCENTIKIIMDPICVHNYALDDKNKEWSKEEELKRDISYTFASFWTASTEARKAIYDQKWSDNGQIKSAAGDSFPVVTGTDYDEQMKMWNDLPAHKSYKDKDGFNEVLKIWNEGRYWDVIDKCWTSTVTEKGDTVKTMEEWLRCGDQQVAGAWFTEKNWADSVKSRLSDWDSKINGKIVTADKQLKDAFKKLYGK